MPKYFGCLGVMFISCKGYIWQFTSCSGKCSQFIDGKGQSHVFIYCQGYICLGIASVIA